jgi:CheY-like chemotaxis protein
MMKIIVVDDREENLESARSQLSALGHDVTTFQSSEYFLQYSRWGHPEKADLLILDLMMPEETSGVHEQFQTNMEHPYGIFYALDAARGGEAKKIVVYSAGNRHNGAMPMAYSAISRTVHCEPLPPVRINESEVYFLTTSTDPKDYSPILEYVG